MFLVALQGLLGWFMVKSGLTENIDVSHYRLSLHLSVAFIILSLTLWNYFKVSKVNTLEKKIPFYLPNLFFSIIYFKLLLELLFLVWMQVIYTTHGLL